MRVCTAQNHHDAVRMSWYTFALMSITWICAHAQPPPERLVLRGRVVTSKGEPLAGVKVSICPLARADAVQQPPQRIEWLERAVTTDANGEFSFENIREGKYELQVLPEKYQDYIPELLTIKVDANIQPVTIRMHGFSSLSGVILAPDGKPAANASVYVIAVGQRSPSMSIGVLTSGVTDARGHFSIPHLLGGSVKMLVIAKDIGYARIQIEIPHDGKRTGVEIHLKRGATLKGIAREQWTRKPIGGARIILQPLSGAAVLVPAFENIRSFSTKRSSFRGGVMMIQRWNGHTLVSYLFTEAMSDLGPWVAISHDGTGEFQIRGVPAGRYRLVVSKRRHIFEIFPLPDRRIWVLDGTSTEITIKDEDAIYEGEVMLGF